MPDEEACQPFGRDFLNDGRRIARRASDTHRHLIDIGSENLYLWRRHQFFALLSQQDRDRIGFFPGRASGDPDPHLVVRPFALEQLWDHQRLERLKGCRIAKEIGNADQEVSKQCMDLIRLSLQPVGIVLQISRLDHLHAALNAALEAALLVFTEIVPGAAAQQTVNLGQSVTWFFGVEGAPIADISDDPLGNILDRELQINKARSHRARWHLGEARP
jgi:hypothetical protein